MTATPQDVLDLLRRVRMDLTNAQGKLTDVMRGLAALSFEERVPLGDFDRILRQVANGVLVDEVDLEAELRAVALSPEQVADLRAALAALNEVEVVVRERP